MGRPPSNGGPAFRFSHNEVAEMEAILQQHKQAMPDREVLVAIADKFSESPGRKGKISVQMKQVWNWFQNRRYAIRAKSSKAPAKLNITQVPRDDTNPVKNAPHPLGPPAFVHAPTNIAAPSVPVPVPGRMPSENSSMEFEAKSGRDGAWYDVGKFLSHRYLDKGEPEVLVRFSGFGSDEDEWINVRKNVRQRSFPCEASECVAVLAGDLILCFQEGKDQALYFDAHVLDAQRRRHDVRGCRCRFLVRYDHDQSEEIVPLRKVCRRPETDYRLQQLHAAADSITQEQQQQQKSGTAEQSSSGGGLQKVSTTSATTEIMPKQRSLESLMSVPPKAPESSSGTAMNAGNAGVVSTSIGNVVRSSTAPSSSS
ncbi:Protein SAWADEE HOMEODOMAIN HOMOLOG 2 [Linum grandiflorum]